MYLTTKLDKENLDSSPHMISHGEKIGGTRVFHVPNSVTADHVCAAMQVEHKEVEEA